MAIRTILVPLTGTDDDTVALHGAFEIARRFGAFVDAVFVQQDPRSAVPILGDGLSVGLIEEIMTSAEREGDRREAVAGRHYRDAVSALEAGHGGTAPSSSFPSSSAVTSSAVTSRFRAVVGQSEEAVVQEGRLADLTILVNGDPAGWLLRRDAMLMGTGRPVLLLPPVGEKGRNTIEARRIVVAWNGSREATRAVAAALPFLKRADAVHVLTVETGTLSPGMATRLVAYLEWHDVTARLASVPTGGDAIGASILAKAASLDADFIVSGAYGHNRLRELILGGVTGHFLAHTPVPLLMAH